MKQNTMQKRRKALGLTQQDLAWEADCSIASIGLFEKGFTPIDSNVLPRVFATLDRLEAANQGET